MSSHTGVSKVNPEKKVKSTRFQNWIGTFRWVDYREMQHLSEEKKNNNKTNMDKNLLQNGKEITFCIFGPQQLL